MGLRGVMKAGVREDAGLCVFCEAPGASAGARGWEAARVGDAVTHRKDEVYLLTECILL